MTARGKRPVWKGPFFKPFNLPKLDLSANSNMGPSSKKFELRTDARDCTILPSFVGHTFHVHNGMKYIPVKVTEDMIGHRLGEFSISKKMAAFKADSKKGGR